MKLASVFSYCTELMGGYVLVVHYIESRSWVRVLSAAVFFCHKINREGRALLFCWAGVMRSCGVYDRLWASFDFLGRHSVKFDRRHLLYVSM